MNVKRRLALVTATLTIALGSGHLMQTVLSGQSADDTAMGLAAVASPMPSDVGVIVASVGSVPSAPNLSHGPLAAKPAGNPAPAAVPAQTVAAVIAEPCGATLDLVALPNAMVSLALAAPCDGAQRVVVRHAGLAFTARTAADGRLVLTLPALEREAVVSVLLPSGTPVEASVTVPESGDVRRFAVQWMADDALQVHAFERGAGYGEPGHVSAIKPDLPNAERGWLTALGDASVDLPMLAEVYTYPRRGHVDLVVEAAITSATCARELLAETINSVGGEVFVSDLSVAMPDCVAVGDFLVLKDLVLDPKIAAAN